MIVCPRHVAVIPWHTCSECFLNHTVHQVRSCYWCRTQRKMEISILF